MESCRKTTIIVNFLLGEDGHAHSFSGVRVEMESCIYVASCKEMNNAVYFMFRMTCLPLVCCVCLFHIKNMFTSCVCIVTTIWQTCLSNFM